MFATEYDGPLSTDTLDFGGRAIRLVRPADPDRLLNDPTILELNRRDDYMPYWAYLWPGASLLAEAVAARTWTPGTHAVELGCGLGLAGLVAMAMGLDVTFTDYDEAPLRMVTRSVEANGFDPSRARFELWDWRETRAERFPLILGADVLYERRLVPLVCDVIRATLAPGGEALVAGPYRVATQDLEACLASRDLTASASPVSTGGARGTLHAIRHRVSRDSTSASR